MPVLKTISSEGAKDILIWTDEVDQKSIDQLQNVAKLPFVFHHVAAMPDVHAGMGATIGSVIATEGAVIPSAVGVDIGCGMLSVRTNLRVGDAGEPELRDLMRGILARVPVGMTDHKAERIPWEAAKTLEPGMTEIEARVPGILAPMTKATWQSEIGTLGSGNHFIELSAAEDGSLWIMLHSGSRGPGNIMASWFIALARKRAAEEGLVLPDPALAFLEEGTQAFEDYMLCAMWAQRYALLNRETMLGFVLEALRETFPGAGLAGEVVNCHHNFVERETHFGHEVWVTRKGATSAKKGELGIIPGSMGRESYIVRGLGNPDSFCSSSHGAGRKMSRTAAKRAFTCEDLREQTAGVVCRRDASVIDEIPAAYKDISVVMRNQCDLVEPVVRMKQILCVKG